jgi:hypothetical protein
MNRRRVGDYSPPEGIGEDRSGEDGIGEEVNTGIDDTSASTRRFVKPSFLDVSSYCLERKNAVDPQAFLDHYESNGWKIGKASMKDWRAAARNWIRRDKKENPARNTAGNGHSGQNGDVCERLPIAGLDIGADEATIEAARAFRKAKGWE